MKSEYTLFPYDEIQLIKNKGILTLSAPWVSMDVNIDDESAELVEKAISDATKKINSNELSNFISFFKDYPIYYSYPRDTLNKEEKKVSLSFNNMATPYELCKKTNSILDIAAIPAGV